MTHFSFSSNHVKLLPLIEVCNTRRVTFGEGEMIGSDLEIASAEGKVNKGSKNPDNSFSSIYLES